MPRYEGELPSGHNGLGLGLLGIRGDEAIDPETYARIRAEVLTTVRGTVQADILKEDQAQNTCIFGTEFSLKVMGDIQEWFVDNGVRNFYSVSISGYHIAEAGANPITQLAFTLANGFTYVEAYRARGLDVNDFAPNFSFFFSNGLDAEYNVIGGWLAGFGRSPCATSTGPTSEARNSSTTFRRRADLCTPRRWPSTTPAQHFRP